MRSVIITIALSCAAILTVNSCKKNETAADPSKVVITITSPTVTSIYRNGDSVDITASVSYITAMHGYEVHITDSATGDGIYSVDEHAHSDAFIINESFRISDTVARVLKMQLVTEIDHNGTSAEKQVIFHYKP